MSEQAQEELKPPPVLFAERDRRDDMIVIVDMLFEQFKKTGKFDRDKPFGHPHHTLDIATRLFGIPDVPFEKWTGYTDEQFKYCEELWSTLGEFITEWWERNKP